MKFPLINISERNLLLTLALAAIALYSQTLTFDFTYDDVARIEKSSLITNPEISLSSIILPFFRATFPNNLYRPIVEFSFRLNFLLGGKSPLSFHLVNILLHTFAVILCYFLVKPFSKTNSTPFIIALLFAIHPINVESVSNICGRYEIMATIFAMLACLSFKKAILKKNVAKQHFAFMLAALIYAAGCLSKESGYTFLIIIPLYSYALLRGDLGKYLRGTFYLLIAAMLTLLARFEILKAGFIEARYQELYESTNPLMVENFIDRILPSAQILGRYVFDVLEPISLAADYSASYLNFWGEVYSIQGLFNLLTFVAFLVIAYRFRESKFTFFSLWFLFSFALTCNFLLPIGTLMASRLAYAPSIGLIAFVIFMIRNKFGNIVQFSFYIFFFASFLSTSLGRIPAWKNNETLFKQMTVDRPESPNANLFYGGALLNKGDLLNAEPYLRKAHELRGPSEYQAAQRLTKLFYLQGKFGQTEYWLGQVLKIKPDQLEAKKMLLYLQETKVRRS